VLVNRSLGDWAQIAEIVAALAVVVSLLALAFTISQNTAAIEAAEERSFLESWRNVAQLPFYLDKELAAIQLKVHTGEELNALESKRWENYLRALFDTWWQLYSSYRDGLVSERTWQDINSSVLTLWELERMGEFWKSRGKYWANTPFGDHINSEIARMNGEEPESQR